MSCPTYPEIDLAEWGEILLEPLQGRRYPLGGTLELTDRCNLACVHCYINQPAASRETQARELITDQVLNILDQITEAGCLFLLLTGGEILLRPDFPEIYRQIKRRGLLVTLFTNATLVTQRIADLLADLRPQGIEISLYGASQKTYEKVTQAPGSYARCRRGIELLLERRLPVALKTVLLTINSKEIDEMKILAEELGVPFRYDVTLWPRVDGSQAPYTYQISSQEIIALDLEDSQRKQEWEKTAELFSGQMVRSEYVFNCGAGLRTFHINSLGQLSICMMSRHPSFDLLHMSFREGWERLGTLRQEKRKLSTTCQTCTVGALCSQCPGWSQSVHGDNETLVDSVCELGHLRAMQFQSTDQNTTGD